MQKGTLLSMLTVVGVCLQLIWGSQAVGAEKGMPQFALPGLTATEGTVRSEDFQDRVLLVNFWATWCPPCRREIPSLIRLADEYGDKGLVVLGISLDRGKRDKISAFISKMGVDYPVALGNNNIAKQFGALGAIPSSFLVDRQGRIVKKYPGYTSYEKLRAGITQLLAAEQDR